MSLSLLNTHALSPSYGSMFLQIGVGGDSLTLTVTNYAEILIYGYGIFFIIYTFTPRLGFLACYAGKKNPPDSDIIGIMMDK